MQLSVLQAEDKQQTKKKLTQPFECCTTLFNCIIKISKARLYKKRNHELSLKEGSIVTGVTIGGYVVLNYFFKISPPNPKLDINDVLKLGFGIIGGVGIKDYVLNQKWINH